MAQINNRPAHGENGATFEQSFVRLQEVVQRLSDGNLTLQEALASFEEGMSLADKCARMLEEAELRVKQVSERAARSGASSLAELDEAMRNTPSSEEPELITFEVESYENTILFTAPEKGPGARDQGSEIDKKQIRNSGASTGRFEIRNHQELDPLFDEDD